MDKGYLDQKPQGLQPTQFPPTTDTNIDRFPPKVIPKSHFAYISCFQATYKLYDDPTGRFVTPSISGTEFILVVYDYHTNTIHAKSYPARLTTHIIATYEKILYTLSSNIIFPKLLTIILTIYNKMSTALVDFYCIIPHVFRLQINSKIIQLVVPKLLLSQVPSSF